MDNVSDLGLLLRSRYPLVMAETKDEERFMELLRSSAASLGVRIWTWSCTRGLAADGQVPQYDTTDAKKALSFVASLNDPGVFVFADAHHALDDTVALRQVKEMAEYGPEGKTLIMTGPERTLPPDLVGVAVAWTLKPPSEEELKVLVDSTLQTLSRRVSVNVDPKDVEGLIGAVKGLSALEARRVIEQAALSDGTLDSSDVAAVRKAKAQLLETTGVLEIVEPEAGTIDEQVGGMARLKEWLRVRGRAFEPAAQQFGLEPPRGVLVTGIPGCGKSLVAKTLARTWSLPLVLLDPGRLYGPYVGESEHHLKDALATSEAMAPAVLWVDEIEKGFSSGEGDAGVSQRLLGSFLHWMQERPNAIFLIATANQVDKLPPEFLRKGRFDEIFFVDLPNEDERAAILALQLRRRKRDPSTFDLKRLAQAAGGFAGAEIEAAVVGALYRAYGEKRELTTEDVAAEIESTVPLSATRAEEITALRSWAEGRAVPAS